MAALGAELPTERTPGLAPELRWRPFPGFSVGFLSLDKSVVRPIAALAPGPLAPIYLACSPNGSGRGPSFVT